MTAAGRWGDRAACRGVDPEVFNAKTAARQQRAIDNYCASCPVRVECLADALSLPADQDHYVRGGHTAPQRRALRKRPDLPTGRDAVTIAALRQLLDQEQPHVPRHPAPTIPHRAKEPTRMTTPMTTRMTTTPAPAVPAKPQEPHAVRSIADLLTWAEQHADAQMRKHATTARTALAAIQQRHATAAELEKVQREAAELRERLAQLEARENELAPKKQWGYDPTAVRAWALEQGLTVPAYGPVPKAVVAAWREQGEHR